MVSEGGLVLPSRFARCRDADSLALLGPSFQVPRNMDPPCFLAILILSLIVKDYNLDGVGRGT
jgi:hypothetical protein